MLLKDFLENVSPIGCDITIWGQYDREEPLFKGGLYDVPWIYTKCKIGYADGDTEPPIYLNIEKNEYGVDYTMIIANIIED